MVRIPRAQHPLGKVLRIGVCAIWSLDKIHNCVWLWLGCCCFFFFYCVFDSCRFHCSFFSLCAYIFQFVFSCVVTYVFFFRVFCVLAYASEIIACKWDRQSVCFVLLLFRFGGGSSWFGTIALWSVVARPLIIVWILTIFFPLSCCVCVSSLFFSKSISPSISILFMWIERMPNCCVACIFYRGTHTNGDRGQTHRQMRYEKKQQNRITLFRFSCWFVGVRKIGIRCV